MQQIESFNLIMFIAIVLFNTALSKTNTSKIVDKHSQQMYLEIEELKDEIRGNNKK